MVKSATRRSAKYSAKIVGDVIKNRIDAQKDSMVSNATPAFGELEAIETATKNLLTGWGVSTALVAMYLSFSRQLYGLSKRHTGTILENEACLATKKWGDTLRGLNMYYLQVIALDVHNIDVSACT